MVSKQNPSGSSQIQGLVDLLMDLEIVNQRQDSSEESSSSNQEAVSEGKQDDMGTRGCGDGERFETAPLQEKLESPSAISPPLPLSPPVRPLQPLGSQSVEECQDSQTAHSSIPEVESKESGEGHLSDEREGFAEQANKSFSPSSSTLSLKGLEAKQSLNKAEDLPMQLSQSSQQEESKNQPLPSKRDLNQPEKLDAPSEQVFNQLIQSQWKKALGKEQSSSSILSTDHRDIDNSIELFERWQRLLLTQEMMDSRQALAKLQEKLESLEHQIYEPTELINLLLPLIAEILSLKVAESKEDVAKAIAPIMDEMIQRRTQENRKAMSSALAPVLPNAVAQQVINSPGDFGKALGPEMGIAIKEQISLERDVMVDALYPVIGSTISKYMAEAIKSINEKVENTLSLEGISRKIRAKIQGVSEAELIFKEAMPFTVQAVFLIHKGSGLVISEMQPSDTQRLESEMVAGMLTAIRSFVNDCIVQSGDVSEIDQIEYGNSQITLEVAGYCYLAAVTQGEPPKSFMQKMRKALGTIVQNHDKAIELFDGDPSNVPEPIQSLLQELTKLGNNPTKAQKRKPPVALIVIGLGVLSAIFVPWGINQHLSAIDRRHEEETSSALASDPELAVYRLMVDANRGTLKLSGRLPNEYLRSRAAQVAQKVEPTLKVQNAIIPVVVPPDPVSAQAEVKRVTDILNQIEGTVIAADYTDGRITVHGAVLEDADAKKITQAFQQIPGVKSVTNTVQLQPLAITSRVYFEQESSELSSDELSKISVIKGFLDQHPNKHLKLLGHTDPRGTDKENQQLALERATKVKNILIAQGVDPKRLQAEGTTRPPLGVKAEQLPLLSRCVQFEMISP